MAFVADFTITQSALSPNLVVAADTHTGTDAAVTQRRIYVADTAGTYYVPSGTTTDYTAWALVDTSISLNILTTDIAATITVQWLNSANVVLYTLTQEFCLDEYNKQFFYSLAEDLALTPGIYQDTTYSSNLAILWTNIKGAEVAVETGDDIAASQNCLDRASNMRINESLYF